MELAMTLPNIIGLFGVFLILVAYFLIQIGKISSEDLAFPLLNGIGASLHLYSLFYYWNVASFVIEVFWILISVYGVWKVLKVRAHSKKSA